MSSECSRAPELLSAVVHYEDAVWATTDAPSAALGVRNTAVREALAAGWTADEIAHEVHVKPEDVHRWASAASPW